MRYTKIFLFAALSSLTLSCNKEMESDQPVAQEGITQIFASFADGETKTVLADDSKTVLWSPNDEISVFYNGDGLKFTSINQSPKATTMFVSSGTVMIGSTEDYGSTPYLYGIYPYSSDNNQSGDTLMLTVPATQTGAESSFGHGAFPSVGRLKTQTSPSIISAEVSDFL